MQYGMMIKGMDFGIRLFDFITLILAFIISVILDEFCNLCVPQFPHLEHDNSNNSCLYVQREVKCIIHI